MSVILYFYKMLLCQIYLYHMSNEDGKSKKRNWKLPDGKCTFEVWRTQ